MADDFQSGDKTELPTERRREEIRERGNVARSTDLNVAVSVLAAASVLYFFGGDLSVSLVEVLRKSLSAEAWHDIDVSRLSKELWQLTAAVAGAILPGFALVVASAVLVNAMQVGFLVTTEPLVPNFERINPLSGAAAVLAAKLCAAGREPAQARRLVRDRRGICDGPAARVSAHA